MEMKQILRVMLPVAAVGVFAASAEAAITYTGDVEPTSPTTWTSATTGYVGNTANGSLSIDSGSSVSYGYLIAGMSNVTGVITVTGSGSALAGNYLYLGYKVGGTGELLVSNGATVTDVSAYLGQVQTPASQASTGIAVINGAGSTWTNTGTLYVGYIGKGTSYLTITNGGAVSAATVDFTSGSRSSGDGTVDGSGSTLTTTTLNVGYGTGSPALGPWGLLSISDGGAVKTSTIGINSVSTLTVDVASNLNAGSGTITNNGTVRLVAGADAAAGTYSPVSAGTWSGSGAYQALGGVWNSTNHTITVNSAITTTAGTVASMDLYTNQRGIVTDPSTGKSVGLGFQATTASNPITFSATAIGGSELSSLQTLIGTGKSVLSAWSLNTTGTTISSTNPVYLSLTAGAGQSLASLSVYDFNGTSWSQLTPADLAYDGNYASFTALNLNDVAVVGAPTPTPIPAAVWLLGSGLMGLVGIKKKRNLTAC